LGVGSKSISSKVLFTKFTQHCEDPLFNVWKEGSTFTTNWLVPLFPPEIKVGTEDMVWVQEFPEQLHPSFEEEESRDHPSCKVSWRTRLLAVPVPELEYLIEKVYCVAATLFFKTRSGTLGSTGAQLKVWEVAKQFVSLRGVVMLILLQTWVVERGIVERTCTTKRRETDPPLGTWQDQI